MCQKVKKRPERDKLVLQSCGLAVLQPNNSPAVMRSCSAAVEKEVLRSCSLAVLQFKTSAAVLRLCS